MNRIQNSLDIVNKVIDVDYNSYEFAVEELKKRKAELTPLFIECIEKCISIQEISPELNDEWNNINLALSKFKKYF